MHSYTGARPIYRHKAIPSWAFNTAQLRELIVHFMERRVGHRTPQKGQQAERLQRAKAQLVATAPRLTDLLTNLCREYVEVKKQDPTDPRVRELEVEIANIDTQLLFINKAELLIAGVVFRSYRLGENSVEVGKAVGIKPTHVRMLLHRLNLMWNKLPEYVAAAPAAAERKARRDAAAVARAEKKAEVYKTKQAATEVTACTV